MGTVWTVRSALLLTIAPAAPAWGVNPTSDTTTICTFCGSLEQSHSVLRSPPKSQPPPVPDGKARLYIFWRGSRLRSWKGVQCKVALDGRWVAVLSKNTYSQVDVDPGKLRLCAAPGVWRIGGDPITPTWRSLMFLHVSAGEKHYIECSPGGDDFYGQTDPSLSEIEEPAGAKVVSRHRLVTFELKAVK